MKWREETREGGAEICWPIHDKKGEERREKRCAADLPHKSIVMKNRSDAVDCFLHEMKSSI